MKLVPKYQEGDLVARQDNTRVVKSPTFKSIKRVILPKPKPQFIQDNRTGWQKERSNQIKSDRAKSEALYKNQHVWNWSNYGSNIRVTPSNASQVYNFNKDAAIGTFTIGTGLANPITTATSLVGSFAGAGVGNQIAGDKGTLVGGLIGGLANPKIIKSASNIGDEYTTIGGRFGYYGNPIERVWHTIGRNNNWSVSAKSPELLRKLNTSMPIKNGRLQVTNPNPRRTETITNFTTDRPVVSHKAGKWDHMDLNVFDPKITKGMKPKSIEPSDTFYSENITAKPSQTTLVSGNPLALIKAKREGLSTLSSPELRRIWNEMNSEYVAMTTLPRNTSSEARKYQKRAFKDNVHPETKRRYANEIQRLQSKRGTPTVKDYMKVEKETGLDAGVVDIKELNPNKVNQIVMTKGNFTYPNNGWIDASDYSPKAWSKSSTLNRAPYNKVFYDPASTVEATYRLMNNIKNK